MPCRLAEHPMASLRCCEQCQHPLHVRVWCHVGAGKSVIATDVLWSDPAPEPGLVENEARGVGLLFGPDVTQVATASFFAACVLQYKL